MPSHVSSHAIPPNRKAINRLVRPKLGRHQEDHHEHRRKFRSSHCRTIALARAAPAVAKQPTLPALSTLVDPIFAAIERHQRAQEALEVVEYEIERLYELADETVGPSYIPVLDMRTGPVHLYVDDYTLSDISDLTPGVENQELRMFYINRFEERKRERNARHGLKNPANRIFLRRGAVRGTVDRLTTRLPPQRT